LSAAACASAAALSAAALSAAALSAAEFELLELFGLAANAGDGIWYTNAKLNRNTDRAILLLCFDNLLNADILNSTISSQSAREESL